MESGKKNGVIIDRNNIIIEFYPEKLEKSESFHKPINRDFDYDDPPMHHKTWKECKKNVKIIDHGPYGIPVFNSYILLDEEGKMKIPSEILLMDIIKNSQVPKLLFISGVHAREWQSQKILLNFLKEINECEIIDKIEKNHIIINISIITTINMPGYLCTISNHIMNSGSIKIITNEPIRIDDYQKNRMTRKYFQSFGVDLNRNFDFFWKPFEEGDSIEIFPGKRPFSEPESLFLKKIIENNNFDLVIDFHDYGDFITKFPLCDIHVTDELEIKKEVANIKILIDDFIYTLSNNLFKKDEPEMPYYAHGIFTDWSSYKRCIAATLEIGKSDEEFRSDMKMGSINQKKFMNRLMKYLFKNNKILMERSIILKSLM